MGVNDAYPAGCGHQQQALGGRQMVELCGCNDGGEHKGNLDREPDCRQNTAPFQLVVFVWVQAFRTVTKQAVHDRADNQPEKRDQQYCPTAEHSGDKNSAARITRWQKAQRTLSGYSVTLGT